MKEQPNTNAYHGSLGVGIGLMLWGICFLALPRYMGISDGLAWILSIIGFIMLLIGIMGTCVELFDREKS